MQGEQILIIGHSTWTRWRQTHEFAVRLARKNRVIFVEKFCAPADLRWRGLSWYDVIRRLAPQKPRPINDNLAVLYPPVVLPTGIPILSRLWGKEIMRVSIALSRSLGARWLRWELHRVGFHPTVLFIAHPNELLLAGRLGERVSCFYVYDELALFQPHSLYANIVDEFELRHIGRVDMVFASSRSQYERRKACHKAVYYMPNAVDFEAFSRAQSEEIACPPELADLPVPRIGYVGSLDERLDFDLLTYLSELHPEWSLVLIGWVRPQVKQLVDELIRRPNVICLASKALGQIPAYLKGLDVGLIPFLVNPSTNTMYPLKLHEYLAVGLPVVSTNLDEVKALSEVVSIANDPSEFVFLIEQALGKNSAARIEQRGAVARENSWENRVKDLEALIDRFPCN